MSNDRFQQLFLGRQRISDSLLHLLNAGLDGWVDNTKEEVLFPFDIVIKASFFDGRRMGNLLQSGPVVAPLSEEFAGFKVECSVFFKAMFLL